MAASRSALALLFALALGACAPTAIRPSDAGDARTADALAPADTSSSDTLAPSDASDASDARPVDALSPMDVLVPLDAGPMDTLAPSDARTTDAPTASEAGPDDALATADADPQDAPVVSEASPGDAAASDAPSEASCDVDHDGFAGAQCGGADCDDTRASVHPGAADVCGNGVDDNCDGRVDEGTPTTAYRDADNDGRGDPATSMTSSSCAMTPGYVTNHDDCDDTRAETYAGAREQCDGRDNDCSLAGAMAGGVDPSEDRDGDRHSPLGAACFGRDDAGGASASFPKDDCDDTRASVYAGAMEVCGNGIDDNCDAIVDNPTQTLCDDADADGHGDPSTARTVMTCSLPAGAVTLCDDCDDSLATGTTRFPGNREVCDRVDNDCSTPSSSVAPDEDADNDGDAPLAAPCVGRGEPGAPASALPKTDCDDADPNAYPGAPESCDRVDSDCSSGGGVAVEEDRDNDGWAPTAAACLARGQAGASSTALPRGDCDDARATVNPGISAAADIASCDGLDNDCDPATSELTAPCGSGGSCAAGSVCGPSRGVRRLAAGNGSTCAGNNDGSVQCWGDNIRGQLGDGTLTAHLQPTLVPGLSGVVQLDAGDQHVCARMTDGTVRCWGDNTYGQLGDGTFTLRSSPTVVPGLAHVVELAAGSTHTCARLTDGTVRCWGDNSYSQLGDGSTSSRLSPTAVPGLSGVAGLAAGFAHTCALLTDSSVRCWGYNSEGQLGDGSVTTRSRPVVVAGLSGVVALAAGMLHTCALLTDGTARCWGYNGNGELGDGTTARSRPNPAVVVGLAAAVQLVANTAHTCARLSDGSARCWGWNQYGPLGDGTTTARSSPTVVPGLTTVAELTAGGYHTCASLTDGSVLCWGLNASGQLGDGTTTNHPSPTLVPTL